MSNKYKLSNKIWKKLSPEARAMFNSMMRATIRNQEVVNGHPKALKLKPVHWRTVCYNISCMAAWEVDGHNLRKGDVVITGKKKDKVK